MASNVKLAQYLYEAFERADAERLLELLHPEFIGHVSDGMPDDVGGTHVGPQNMLTEVWAPIARRFGVRPVPEQLYACTDGTVIAIGSYVGEPPRADGPLNAAFAHVLAFRDDRSLSCARSRTPTAGPRQPQPPTYAPSGECSTRSSGAMPRRC